MRKVGCFCSENTALASLEPEASRSRLRDGTLLLCSENILSLSDSLTPGSPWRLAHSLLLSDKNNLQEEELILAHGF